jgi:hypothetical protein
MHALPADLAQRQLDAYNAHDLDAFCACYAEDVQVYALPTMALTLEGRAALHARYGPYFEAKRPHAALVGARLALGTMAIDVEAVRLADGTEVDAIALYHVADGLIQRVWFIRGEG